MTVFKAPISTILERSDVGIGKGKDWTSSRSCAVEKIDRRLGASSEYCSRQPRTRINVFYCDMSDTKRIGRTPTRPDFALVAGMYCIIDSRRFVASKAIPDYEWTRQDVSVATGKVLAGVNNVRSLAEITTI